MQIFLSSTSTDLEPYRHQVEQVIQRFDEVYRGMEYFGASSEGSLATCLRHVEQSAVVICVVGTRYGSLTSSGKSFTHCEVEHALSKGIPVLAYLMDVNRQPVLPVHVATGTEHIKLREFREYLNRHVTTALFTTPEDLGIRVAGDLFRFHRETVLVQGGAFEELQARLIGRGPAELDAFAVTAHNLDVMFTVDLVAADYETTVGNPTESPGGSGANTAYALGRLGMRVAATGIVATDGAGVLLKQDLHSAGVDVEQVLSVPASDRVGTGRTNVYTDPRGQRSIYVYPGVNELFAATVRSTDALEALRARIGTARILHLSSFTGAAERRLQEYLVSTAPFDGVVSLNPGALYAKLGVDRLAGLLKRVNVLHVYEHQLDRLLEFSSIGRTTGAAPLQGKLERLFQWRTRRGHDEPLVVVIKVATGMPMEQAAIACGKTEVEQVIPTQARALRSDVPSPIDATGAGDAMAAGVLYGLLTGRSLSQCADLAFAMGASATSGLGARSGLPTEQGLASWFTDSE
jgi:ribokinase